MKLLNTDYFYQNCIDVVSFQQALILIIGLMIAYNKD